MTRVTDTRAHILERAAELLTSRGYNGFSYRDISTHLGVRNAAIHYHFPAKADLALALIDEYRQTLRKRTAEFMAYGGSALAQLEAFFVFTSRQCHMGRCICPVGAFSVDFIDLPEAVRRSMAEFMEETLKWLTQVLEVGREQQEFRFEGPARSRALAVLAAIQGARQMARINGLEILEDVVVQIRNDLGT